MNHELKNILKTVLCLVMVCAFPHVTAAEEIDESGKVAVVNGTVISQEQFDRELLQVTKVLDESGTSLSDDDMAVIKDKVLENIIKYELLYQECQKEGVEIDGSEINKKIDEQRSQFSSDDEFHQRLKDLGKDESLLKTQIEKNLAIQRLINQKFKPTVTDSEAKKYYNANPDEFKQEERVRASHILIKVDADDYQSKKDAAKKQIEGILERVRNGEDFAELAQKYSDCPSSQQGGDLDFFSKGQMVKPFEETAFAMGPGDISDIVETEFGYHIIKVTDKQGPRTFDEAKDDIKRTLGKQKIADSYSKFYADVRSKAKIDVFLESQ
jgi:peptidyl-prolyl cis-trans isomerase C